MKIENEDFFVRRCFGVALLFMGVTFAIGVLLRAQFVFPVGGFPFSYVVHAHSHVGFLGWVFNGFFALAFCLFVREEDRGWFWRLFWLCQVGVVGMLVTFPIQGYGLWSIVFSTLHLLCSMVFVWRLMKRNRATGLAAYVLKIGGWMLLASSVGPLAMGPIMVTELRDTIWRDLGVYYYLHFQYNGWFVFFLLAAALQCWGDAVSVEVEERAKFWVGALAWGVVLTYAQSALWVPDVEWVSWVAGIGGVVQVFAVLGLWKVLRGLGALFEDSLAAGIGRWVLVLFGLKVVLQLVAVVPGVRALGEQHFMVIAFLHLMFLGVVTPLLWAWGIEMGVLKTGWRFRAGLVLFVMGAVVSQMGLVAFPLSGAMGWGPVPFVFEGIFYGSVGMLVACVWGVRFRW